MPNNKWVTKKPKFTKPCLVVAAYKYSSHYEYEIYIIDWVDSMEDGKYLGWLLGDGQEYGDLADFTADKYLVLPLPKN